jgi:uncharacterized repeat protein (TIGR01451 family)
MPAPLNSGVLAVSSHDCCIGEWEEYVLALRSDGCLYYWRPGTSPKLLGCGWDLPTPPIGPFSKTAPVSGTVGLPITVTLIWSAPVTGTVHSYRYCYATTAGCTPSTQVPSTTTSVTVSGLTPGATYHWQVRACAIDGCGSFTDANSGTHWTFTVKPLPAQSGFNKTAPANGASGVSTAPTLSWNPSSGAVYYQVCYDTNLNGACNGTWQNVNGTSQALSGLAPGATYEWQVRACDDDVGCNGGADNGAWWTFTTASGPAGFSKASPLNGTTGHPANLTLSWQSASGQGTVQYDYCIKTVNAPCTAGEWVNVGTATNSGVLSLNPGTIYYWQARACDANGCTQANAGSFWSFQTAQAVGGFNKLAPGNAAINVNTTTAQLQWAEASGASEYKVCLGTAVNNCNILGGGPGQYVSVGTNQFRVLSDLPLQPNTTYYWQVLATNGVYTTFANGSAFSFWSFTTLPSGPEAFNKTAPVFNATNAPTSNITFQWTPANNAVSYTVCVGAFAGDCSYSVTSTATSAVLAGPLPAGATLVWQVTAHNAAGTNNADNNAWWPLTTVPNAPGAFTKFAPLNGATGQPVGVNLTWQDVPDETYYQVCVGTSPGACTFVNVTTTANTTSYALTGLDYGTTYFWQVSACNAGGCTPANNGIAWSFSTQNPPVPGPFGKTGPTNGALNVPTNTAAVLLAWTAASDADGYEVCFGTAPSACDLSGGGFQDVGLVTSRLVSQLPFSVTLAPASTYWWQVRAYNNFTATRTFADNGVEFHFTTAAAGGPGGFSKDAPLNGAFNLPTATLALRWFPASGATSYEVCAGTAANSCDAMPGNTWLNVGSAQAYMLTNLQVGTTYHWQVRAVNAGGTTAANGGAWWAFTTRSVPPPEAFTKAGPPHLATAVPTATAVLSWYVSTGATAYEVCVGSAPGLCEASGGWVNVGNVTQWTLSGLNYATTYWWQVQALNASGQTMADGGAWWRFTTVNDPGMSLGPFRKQAPVHLATGVPAATAILSWTASAGASSYEVCAGSGPGFCEVTGGWLNVGNVTQWAPAGLSAATTYWWQVRARDDAGGLLQADGGRWWAFTTAEDGPAAFAKQTPVQGASGATGYQVCIGTQAGLCDVTGSWVSVGNVTNWPVGAALQPATTYWWQVRAVNSSGQMTQADGGRWWYFTTAAAGGAPAAFGKLLPANNASGQPLNPTLNWDAANDATGYQVCVGLLPGDCSASGGGWVDVGGTSHVLSGLSHATTYWWQVRAVNAGGQTLADGGVWWRFTTLNAPGSPIGAFGKSAPAHEAIGVATNATLSWDAAANAARYTVCVGTQPGLCDVMNNAEATATSLALANAQPGRTYWWQVTAHGASGALRLADEGAWWAFTTANDTATGPGDFNKASPVSGTVVANPVVLVWGTSNGAIRYQVCLGRAIGLCDVLNNAIASSGTGWVLPAGSYWWQVTAVDAEGDTTQADGGIWWPLTVQRAADNVNTGGTTGTRKDVTPTVVRMGELVSYTIVVSNVGDAAVTVQVTDTLAVSATLVSATPGYVQSGQTLVWSNVVVPAGGTAVLTITVRAASGPLPEGYLLFNSVIIGTADGETTRSAPAVQVEPWRAFVPVVMRPPDLLPRVFIPMVMREPQ